MSFSLEELLKMDTIELAIRIDSGDVLTSALLKKSMILLKAKISQVQGIGMSKMGNDKNVLEYRDQEDALKQRLYLLQSLYNDLVAEENGTVQENVYWLPRPCDSDMEI